MRRTVVHSGSDANARKWRLTRQHAASVAGEQKPKMYMNVSLGKGRTSDGSGTEDVMAVSGQVQLKVSSAIRADA